MKTISTRTTLLALLFLLIMSACTSTKNEKETKLDTDVVEEKAPEMDIHAAILADNMEVLNQLIASGTDINSKEPMGGSTPLITAAVFGKTEAAKVLIEAGVDINAVNNEKSTALHSAAFFCHTDIVKMLLAKGVDKTLKNKYQSTALQSVSGPFNQVKPIYMHFGKALEPMGMKIDLEYIEKTRPIIAALLSAN